jgi:hypothetical protein
MKHLKKTLLIGLLSIIFAPTLIAQNIDANRMNRDIRIMENILAEIFRTQAEVSTSEAYTIVAGDYRIRGIRGTYLQDFGIIFMIPSNDPFTPRMHVTGDGSFSFYYSTGSNDGEDSDNASKEVDEEAINDRIAEFLIDYGSTIGQLEDDEKIMVIYGSNSKSSRGRLVGYVDRNGRSGFRNESEEKLPVISGSVTMEDLNNYRSGRIGEGEIKNRIDYATSENKEYMDLKVMGNIFETALRDTDDESYKMSGNIGYMMLDNFGAIYSFDARYGGGRDVFFGRLAQTQLRLRNLQERQIIIGGEANEALVEEAEAIERREEELKQNMIAAFEDLKTNVAQYLVDYGRTLGSVDSDQFILTSVNLSAGGIEEIPERIDFQIKKSVLEQFDRGRISREDAINSVSVTEY